MSERVRGGSRPFVTCVLALLACVLLAVLLVVTTAADTPGTWTATLITAPSDAGGDTSIVLSSVSCSSSGDCTAVGGYADGGGGVVATESSGSWTAAAVTASGSPAPSLSSVSCSASDDCTAVDGASGYAYSGDPDTPGTWTATLITAPSDAGGDTSIVLSSVSCSSSGDCTAVGGYADGGGGVVATESSGSWTAAAVTASGSPAPSLSSVSCSASDDCTAVDGASGYAYSGDPDTPGTWTATLITAPSDAGGDTSIVLSSVSCSSSGDCTAVGGYADGGGGVVATESSGSWTAAAVTATTTTTTTTTTTSPTTTTTTSPPTTTTSPPPTTTTSPPTTTTSPPPTTTTSPPTTTTTPASSSGGASSSVHAPVTAASSSGSRLSPPGPPGGLRAIPEKATVGKGRAGSGAFEVRLTWRAPARDGGSTITGYDVFEGTSPGGERYKRSVNASPLPSRARSYVVAGLKSGIKYYFTVRAINTAGVGARSNEAQSVRAIPPGAPRSLRAIGGGVKVRLTWRAPVGDGGSAIIGYDVYEGTSSAGESKAPVNPSLLPPGTRSYAVTGLANAGHYFTVRAVNSVGRGKSSNEVSSPRAVATIKATPPGAPIDLRVTGAGAKAILTWRAPGGDGGSGITGYDVFDARSSGGEGSTPVNSSPLPPGASSYTVTGLKSGTTYYFTVNAVNAVGVGAASEEVSLTRAGAPGAPGSLKAVRSDTKVTLSWSAPANDGGRAITGYEVYGGTSRGGEHYGHPMNPSRLAPRSTSYTVTGLRSGTTYFFVVQAVNAIGAGTDSNEVQAAGATVPGAPGQPKVVRGDGEVTLTWRAPAGDAGSGLTGYDIYEGTAPGGESRAPVSSSLSSPKATSGTVTGLKNGVKYYFTIRAVNAVGIGPASEEVHATPLGTPGAPGSLRAAGGDGEAALAWTAPSTDGGSAITGYEVYEGTSPGDEGSTPINALPLLPSSTSSTNYDVTGLKNGTKYYFTVRAINAVGAGNPASEVMVVPTRAA